MLELLNRLIGCLDGFHAMAAEVMRGVFHMLFRPAQSRECFADLRMRFLGSCRRGGGQRVRRWRCWSIGLVRRCFFSALLPPRLPSVQCVRPTLPIEASLRPPNYTCPDIRFFRPCVWRWPE